ncbi:MAG: hypothetical protein LVQ75_05460 [Candidatus Babeliales bacterium]
MPPGAFYSITVSDDLRLDSNPSLTTLPSKAFEKAVIGGSLRINGTGITAVPNLILEGAQIGDSLLLSNNPDWKLLNRAHFRGLLLQILI